MRESIRLRFIRAMHIQVHTILLTLCCTLNGWAQAPSQQETPGEGDGPALVFGERPFLQFTTVDTARLRWSHPGPGPGRVTYGRTAAMEQQAEATRAGDAFTVNLGGLAPQSRYHYRIGVSHQGLTRWSPPYTFNTAMNFSPLDLEQQPPDESCQALVKRLLELAGTRKGYAIVLGSDTGRLALELARQSQFTVILFTPDAARAQRMRSLLYSRGVYGSRVAVQEVENLGRLPITSCLANLIVSDSTDDEGATPTQEIKRLLTPGRGVALHLDRATDTITKHIRPPLENSGSWTHQYGNPGNAASAGESLGGATSTDDLQVQWLGRPGGDFGIDRQPRMPAPLSVNGRLFHQGMNRLIALDSYNGQALWEMEIPDLRRLNMPRDAGNWCADGTNLYLALVDQAWILDAQTGERRHLLTLPGTADSPREWGYIGSLDRLVYGSTVKAGSSYRKFWGKAAWFDANKPGPGTAQICSEKFFAYDKQTGKPVWFYDDGLILNSTIALGDNRVYFVVSRNKALESESSGRISSPALWKEQYLVALHAQTGSLDWEQAIDTEDGNLTFYLQHSPHGLIISASNTQYHLYNFDPRNGKLNWQTTSKWAANHHSGHIQHPVIMGKTLYLEPRGFDLETGKETVSRIGRREGCTTYVGSTNALIYRGSGRRISMWDPVSGKTSSWSRLRPSCWLNIITAGGMLQIPEGGAGCSCGGWMETSIVFTPEALLEETGKE